MTLPEEDVQAYPRPPALERVPHEVVAWLGGVEIVRTTAAWRVLETHHAPTYYLPPSEIDAELRPAGGGSVCEWKGRAAYWDVIAGGAVAGRAAWSYPSPMARFAALADHVAIYARALDRATVGGLDVAPQPGGFYGGWVTPNLVGTVKGAPGTEWW